jgi:hypothetical protein
MSATTHHRSPVRRMTRVAPLALALVLATANLSAAAIEEGRSTEIVIAEAVPTAQDDWMQGRRRTGTSAISRSIDPAPVGAGQPRQARQGTGGYAPGVLV